MMGICIHILHIWIPVYMYVCYMYDSTLQSALHKGKAKATDVFHLYFQCAVGAECAFVGMYGIDVKTQFFKKSLRVLQELFTFSRDFCPSLLDQKQLYCFPV